LEDVVATHPTVDASNPDIQLEDPVHPFRSLLIATLLFVVPASLPAAPNTDKTFVKDTRSYLTRLSRFGFAGVVLVEQDGKVVFSEGYGYSDRENKVRWSSRSIGDIGSITKQFTAAAILMLEQDGKLSVTDPLSRHFNDVPDDKRDITLHQLLTHTSGIHDLEDAGDYDPIERDEFMRRIFAQPLASKPGETWAYSNAGFSILGAIIEQITGQSYEMFLRQRLFVPQKMQDTGYIIPKWDPKRVVHGYSHEGPWGTGIEKPMGKDGPYWALRANGGIHSTAEDMRRWADALLDGKALSNQSMKKLWAPQADEGGGEQWYGYGWDVQTMANGDTLIGHDGGNGIFGATLFIVPRQHLVFFLQTNVCDELPFWGGILQNVVRRMHDGEAYPSIPDIANVPASQLTAVAGSYAFDDSNTVDVTPDADALRLTAHGWDAFAIVSSTRDVNLPRCRDLSRRIHRIMAGATNNDFIPLADAYGKGLTPEYLKNSWEKNMAGWTEKHGAFRDFEILGTAMLRERDMTLVRLNFEKGEEYRAYVWDKDDEHNLRGVSGRGLSAQVHLVPVTGGGFASWDPRSGDSRPFVFATENGTRGLQVTAGAQTFLAHTH